MDMEDSYNSDPMLFSAKDMQAWRWKKGGRPDGDPPQAVIFCLQPDLLRRAQKRYPLKAVKGLFGECFRLRIKHKPGPAALAGGLGLGAPAMAIAVEEYAAFGVRRFVSIGLAGSLQPDLHPGDIVIGESALRGEGTSAHYLPPADSVEADPEMTEGMCAALRKYGLQPFLGTSWTTDAPYRETRREAAQRRQEGVACVEMEAAALFAASRSLGVKAAAVFVIADQLSEHGWLPPENMENIQRCQAAVLEAAISWLAGEER